MRGDIKRFLEAECVAVVGASEARDPARLALSNLTAGGHECYGINPSRKSALGVECFPSVADLPRPPDVAMLLVSHTSMEEAARDAIAGGARALVVPGLGAEAGAGSRPLSALVARLAEEAGIPLLGPNCMGSLVTGAAPAWIGSVSSGFSPGSVSVVVQSGYIGESLTALGPRVGFRSILSVGAEAARDVADCCAALAEDRETAVVGLFIETVRRPAAMRVALERLAEMGKPVVCLRVGKSEAGARATRAHTDAILTPARAFAALARHANLIEVGDFAEFVEALELLGRRRLWSSRLAAVTQSGGAAALLGDLAARAGAPLVEFSPRLAAELKEVISGVHTASNPLDAWSIDDAEQVYRRVFELIAGSGEYDTLLLQLDQTPYAGQVEQGVAERLISALADVARRRQIAPLLFSGQSSEQAPRVAEMAANEGIPAIRGSGAGIRAFARVSRWRPGARRLHPLEEEIEWDWDRAASGEFEAGRFLLAQGLPLAERELVEGERQALAAAGRLGFPVVMKADGVPHRRAIGQVVTDIYSPEQLRESIRRLQPPVLVARQIPASPEVYMGGRREPEYGPIVCFGWGGRGAETSESVSCMIAPFDRSAAASMVAELPGLRDSAPPEDLARLAGMLERFSAVIARIPAGLSVDLNPVLLDEERGPIAVDALISKAFPAV